MFFFLTMDLIMKNEKFYSHITEGEFGTLLPGQFLMVIGQDDD